MKKCAKCYACVYCQTCDEANEKLCASKDYILFTTEKQKELCDLLCGEIADEYGHNDN
jgi:hypothetical protein